MARTVTLDEANDAIGFITRLRAQTTEQIRATHPDLIAAAQDANAGVDPEDARDEALRRTGALFDTLLDVLTGAEIQPGAN